MPDFRGLKDEISEKIGELVDGREMPDFAGMKDKISKKISELDGEFVSELAGKIRSFGQNLFSKDGEEP